LLDVQALQLDEAGCKERAKDAQEVQTHPSEKQDRTLLSFPGLKREPREVDLLVRLGEIAFRQKDRR